jgi:hypothetical protein
MTFSRTVVTWAGAAPLMVCQPWSVSRALVARASSGHGERVTSPRCSRRRTTVARQSHDMGEAGEGGVGLGDEAGHAQCAFRCLGEHGHGVVLEVGQLRVWAQLCVEEGSAASLCGGEYLALLELESVAERIEGVEAADAGQLTLGGCDGRPAGLEGCGNGVQVRDRERWMSLPCWSEGFLHTEVEHRSSGREPASTALGERRWLRDLLHPQGHAVVLAGSGLTAHWDGDLNVVEASNHGTTVAMCGGA